MKKFKIFYVLKYMYIKNFSTIEFLLGLTILCWLGFQYGRLISKRLFAISSKKLGNNKPGDKNL